jgi:transcriptional regulator with XRE-family HTH domain
MLDGQTSPVDPGPMVRRQQLGSALRQYRTAAGLSVKEAAEGLLVAPSTITRIEKAQRNAALRDVRALCDLYGISDPAVRAQLMDLARGSRARGWWQDAPLSQALKTLIGMEGSADTIREFEILAIPGLVQTREYANAVSAAYYPDSPELWKSVVEARMKRQEILERDSPPALEIVLDESATRRIVGSRTVMREQLDHLIRVSEQAIAEIRVIPFSAGAYVGMDSGFVILTFGLPSLLSNGRTTPAVVYVETLDGSAYLDQPASVQKYLQAYEVLTAAALDRDDSFDLLRAARRAV